MARTATRSACFQPNEYKKMELFANRSALREELLADLESFIAPDGPGEACILVRGNRGVGKSMLVRRVVHDMVFTSEILRVELDCVRVEHGLEPALRKLAKELAREAIQNALNEGLRASAEWLLKLAELTKVKVREVKSWATKLSLDMSLQSTFTRTLQFEFGIVRAVGRSREVEETSERAVDVAFLQRLIRGFAEDCQRSKTRVLMLVDNLDQVVYAEAKEDVVQVTDLASFLSELPGCVVVATVRTEFVSTDMTKLRTLGKVVPGMSPEELAEVVAARMKSASPERQKRLNDAGFDVLAQTLTQWTNNAWALLSWLQNLDYRSIEISPRDGDGLKDLLLSAIQQDFARLKNDDLERLGRVFEGKRDEYLTSDAIKDAGVGEDLFKVALQCSALVPSYLINADRYMLSPLLHFLA